MKGAKLLFGLIVTFLVGCSPSAAPTPTATPVAATAMPVMARATPVPMSPTAVPPTPTLAHLPEQSAGHWEGNPSVTFDVQSDGNIYNFKMSVDMPSMGTCTVTSDKIEVDPDGAFSFTEYQKGVIDAKVLDVAKKLGLPTPETKQTGGESYFLARSIKGKFDTAAEITGTYLIRVCQKGGDLAFSSEESWNATKKSP
jgi:hypothetical protein